MWAVPDNPDLPELSAYVDSDAPAGATETYEFTCLVPGADYSQTKSTIPYTHSPSAGPVITSVTVIDGNGRIDETEEFGLQVETIAGVTDVTVDWGEGGSPHSDVREDDTDTTFNFDFSYDDDNPTASSQDTYTLTITAMTECGWEYTTTHTVTVHNVAPTITTLEPSGGAEFNEGDTVSITVDIEDVSWNDTLDLVIDWGDGTVETHVDVCMTTFDHVYLDDDADDTYEITATAYDDDGGASAPKTVPVTVRNLDPEVTFETLTYELDDEGNVVLDEDGNPMTIPTSSLNEGEVLIVEGTVTDYGILDTQTVTLEIDLNWDGTIDPDSETFTPVVSVDSSVTPDPASGVPAQWTFRQVVGPIADDGAAYGTDASGNPILVWGNETEQDDLTIAVIAEDDDSGTDSDSTTVSIQNIGPSFVEAGDGVPYLSFEYDDEGNLTNVTAKGEFKDPGTKDFHKISVEWGDGGKGDGVNDPVQLDLGKREFSITRPLAAVPGFSASTLYPVILTLHDDDLGEATGTIESCGCTGDSCLDETASFAEGEDVQGMESALYYAMPEGEPTAGYSMTFQFSDMDVQVLEGGNSEFQWTWKPITISHTSASGQVRNVPLNTASILLDVQGFVSATDNGALGKSKVEFNYKEINHGLATDHQSLGWGPLKKCDYGTLVQTARVYVAEQSATTNPAPPAPGASQIASRVDSSGKYTHDHWSWAGLIAGGWVHSDGYPQEMSPYAPSVNGQSPTIDPGNYSFNNYSYIGFVTTTMRYKIESSGTAWAIVTWKFSDIDDPNPWPTTRHKQFTPVPAGSTVDLP